jgi:excisionase family DNA binding protein
MGPRLCDELLTVKEAAWQMGITVRTLRRWIDAGTVRVVQASRRSVVRISACEVRRVSQSRVRAS